MDLFDRIETVHIYVGDYPQRVNQLEQRLRDAAEEAEGNVLTLDETDETVELAEQYNALVADAPHHRITVSVKKLNRTVSKPLREAHPPRKAGVDGATERQERADSVLGVNEQTFRPALVRASVARMTAPDGSDIALDDETFDKLSEGDELMIFNKALALSYGQTADPKEISLGSLLGPRSEKTSS